MEAVFCGDLVREGVGAFLFGGGWREGGLGLGYEYVDGVLRAFGGL